VALGVASVAVFIVAFQQVGFILPAFLLLIVWMKVLGNESWPWVLVLSTLLSAGLYFCFAVLLAVPFPRDIVLYVLGL
jgi:putative tricarboxylic transport membrane protein